MKTVGLAIMIVLFLGMIVRTILLGSASADGKGLTRQDEPVAFWAALVALITGVIILSMVLLHD